MLRIGQFARIAGVTTRLLRHYEAAGLLPPARTDARTGYRYYELLQIPYLERILAYRAAGISLAIIPDLLHEPKDSGRHLLMQQRTALVQERAFVDRKLAILDLELASQATASRNRAFRIKHTTAVWMTSVREKLATYDQANALIEQVRSGVTGSEDATVAAVWHCCRPMEGFIDCEAQVLFTRRPTSSRVTNQLPTQLVVSFAHIGPDDELPAIYDDIKAWARGARYQLCGPLREVYRTGMYGPTITEVQFPIAPA